MSYVEKSVYDIQGKPCLRTIVPDNKSQNIPEVVLVRRWAVGVLGIWRGGVGWVKGGANGVSLSATWGQVSRRGHRRETKEVRGDRKGSKGNL
jgi:hypothetical protein